MYKREFKKIKEDLMSKLKQEFLRHARARTKALSVPCGSKRRLHGFGTLPGLISFEEFLLNVFIRNNAGFVCDAKRPLSEVTSLNNETRLFTTTGSEWKQS